MFDRADAIARTSEATFDSTRVTRRIYRAMVFCSPGITCMSDVILSCSHRITRTSGAISCTSGRIV